MFDEYARTLIEQLPKLPSLDPVECRRALSRAYMLVVDQRLRASQASQALEDVLKVGAELRRMADALESVAVFDPLNGLQIPPATRQASAFVAAEAIALHSELVRPGTPEPFEGDPIQDSRTYALTESGLLYMVGGYDINALAVVSKVELPKSYYGGSSFVLRCQAGVRLQRCIVALCRGELKSSPDSATAIAAKPLTLESLADNTRSRLYEVLIAGIEKYLAWLGGEGRLEAAVELIERVRRACLKQRQDAVPHRWFSFSDVYHLASLLAAAIDATKSRSSVHGVPPPTDGDAALVNTFPTYIKVRAQGTPQLHGRPFMWPSTLEYVRSCLPGPRKDAVVSMPTGSGKSFLAELAVAHALPRGWVLYLAPTNALAHQIRHDLSRALKPFEGVQVSAFVGGSEYTALSDETVHEGSFVGVMTPEKCALALRLYPAAFARCALCVFDECHLLNDPHRGTVADVLLAQLFHAAPTMRLLLMSAMVSNGDELAAWITSVRGDQATVSRINWRPARAARGFMLVDKDAYEQASVELKDELAGTLGAKTVSRDVSLGWLVGLSGPWTQRGFRSWLSPRAA